ncbi:MAG: TlpA family protein disulfide reductase [Lachnospiraceae bacterium]|nr:TlpA family protein disulfide reductase [Lachnospiraceae bacterium]
MNKNRYTLIIVIVLAVILASSWFLYGKLGENVERQELVTEEKNEPETEESTKSNTPKAPDFTVIDNDGNEIKLSDFEGKPVIVNFWASWCGPCKAEMPEFEEAYKKYGEDIHFLMVNSTDGSQETVESAKEFIESMGYTFPVYYDTKSNAAIVYGVTGLPTTYFINADGNVIAKAVSSITLDTLEKGIGLITE